MIVNRKAKKFVCQEKKKNIKKLFNLVFTWILHSEEEIECDFRKKIKTQS